MAEPRRVVGTENDVRIDAEIYGDRLATSTTLPIKYDITNNRPRTILIAELVPETTYDEETYTVTISIGTEVPGETFLPRLIPIAPGERKTFHAAAHVTIAASTSLSPYVRHPSAVRIRVNFLDDAKPFEELVSIKENAVADRELAAKLFPKWVEDNETVTTNTLPMRWAGSGVDTLTPAAMPGAPRRRRGGGTP
jgi:hypothetical protein